MTTYRSDIETSIWIFSYSHVDNNNRGNVWASTAHVRLSRIDSPRKEVYFIPPQRICVVCNKYIYIYVWVPPVLREHAIILRHQPFAFAWTLRFDGCIFIFCSSSIVCSTLKKLAQTCYTLMMCKACYTKIFVKIICFIRVIMTIL